MQPLTAPGHTASNRLGLLARATHRMRLRFAASDWLPSQQPEPITLGSEELRPHPSEPPALPQGCLSSPGSGPSAPVPPLHPPPPAFSHSCPVHSLPSQTLYLTVHCKASLSRVDILPSSTMCLLMKSLGFITFRVIGNAVL